MVYRVCDLILRYLHEKAFTKGEAPVKREDIVVAVNQRFKAPTLDEGFIIEFLIGPAFAILLDRKFIDAPDGFRITVPGIAFINTTSFEEEKKKIELAEAKLGQEVKINSWLLKTKWVPHTLAFAAVIVSIIALCFSTFTPKPQSKASNNQSHNNQQIADTLKKHK